MKEPNHLLWSRRGGLLSSQRRVRARNISTASGSTEQHFANTHCDVWVADWGGRLHKRQRFRVVCHPHVRNSKGERRRVEGERHECEPETLNPTPWQIGVSDYTKPLAVPDFRAAWEAMTPDHDLTQVWHAHARTHTHTHMHIHTYTHTNTHTHTHTHKHKHARPRPHSGPTPECWQG